MKYYLKNAKHLYIREYFKDESWDMIYEALKMLCKKEGFDDMFEEYDKKYTSMINPKGVGKIGRLMIPLPFWFCNNPGLYLPIVAITKHGNIFGKLS